MERTVVVENLHDHMNEEFIMNAFQLSGYDVTNVKLMGKDVEVGRHCYVELLNINACHEAVRNLNNKIMPRSSPPLKFKITYGYYGRAENEMRRPAPPFQQDVNVRYVEEMSLFVGNLTDEVTSDDLYREFSSRYPTIISAKVLYHGDGRSKSCGFVRFGSVYDQQRALLEMQHMTGLGQNPIHVKLANKNSHNSSTPSALPATPNPHEYQNYQNYYNAWASSCAQQGTDNYNQYLQSADQNASVGMDTEEDTVVEPIMEDNIDEVNEIYMKQSEEFYTALEESRWVNIDDIKEI